MTGLWLVSYIVLWILFLLVSVVLLSVLYHLGVIYDKVDKRSPAATTLSTGQAVSEAALLALDGRKISVSQFRGSPVSFVIISPGCSGCLKVLREISSGHWDTEFYGDKRVVVISTGDVGETREIAEEAELPPQFPIFIDSNQVLKDKWGIRMTPMIVEVDSDLKVTRQTAFASSTSQPPPATNPVQLVAP